MKKTVCGKVYDTDAAALCGKVTFGAFGDEDGYEEALYQNDAGLYFLYTNGGAASVYPKEDIKRMSKDKAEEWLSEHK